MTSLKGALKDTNNTEFKNARKHIIRLLHVIEWTGLMIITLATMVAFGEHIYMMIIALQVKLEDLLLLFIYIEIFTMVALYFNTGKLPIRYPIYIAIVAIARYIIIAMKKLTSWDIVALCLGIVVLTAAALMIRYGHTRMPYRSEREE